MEGAALALRGSAQSSGLPVGGPSSHPGVINLCQRCSYCSFTLCLVVLTFTPGFLRPNSWCPRRYPEVEFPLAKSAGVLLALRAGKGSARCSGLCVTVLTFLLPRPECWDAPALEEQGRCPWIQLDPLWGVRNKSTRCAQSKEKSIEQREVGDRKSQFLLALAHIR